MTTWLTKTFNIKYPIILAPMFLVTNDEMIRAANKAGFMGCIPALNFRTPEKFKEYLKSISKDKSGPSGVNLIVNKGNIYLEAQLSALEKYPIDFVITSLGNPKDVIKRLKPLGVKVFCDVVDVKYALKVEDLGADAVIAVNSGAGGHAGSVPVNVLIPSLCKKVKIPVISAGGVSTGESLLSCLALGSEGASIGSLYIATKESPVSNEYKQALIDYGQDDIVMTTKLSGTPCTVVNTPYVQQVGLKQNFLERILNKNKILKKYIKMISYTRGKRLLEKAAFSSTYKTVFCAGPSIEFVKKIESIESVTLRLLSEQELALNKLIEKTN